MCLSSNNHRPFQNRHRWLREMCAPACKAVEPQWPIINRLLPTTLTHASPAPWEQHTIPCANAPIGRHRVPPLRPRARSDERSLRWRERPGASPGARHRVCLEMPAPTAPRSLTKKVCGRCYPLNSTPTTTPTRAAPWGSGRSQPDDGQSCHDPQGRRELAKRLPITGAAAAVAIRVRRA